MAVLRKALTGLALALPALSLPGAAGAADFYGGKTLNVVVGGAAGGNTDLQSRILLRHMEKHIPGKPRVVVRNMAGSGGMLATNYIGEVAPRDGYTILINTVSLISELQNDPALRVKYSNLIAVGSVGQQGVVHVRKDVAPGINGPADLFKVTRQIKTAGYREGHAVDVHLRLTLDMLGVNYKHVSGFPSSAKMLQAVLQDEVQMAFDSTTGYRRRIVQALVQPGISVPLWHVGVPNESGGLDASPNFPDVPSFLDVYRMKFGKDAMPKGVAWDAYLLVTGMRAKLVRAVLMPQGSPKQAADVLRAAYTRLQTDPEFIAEYEKLNAEKPQLFTGADTQRYMERVTKSSDPKLVAFIKTLGGN